MRLIIVVIASFFFFASNSILAEKGQEVYHYRTIGPYMIAHASWFESSCVENKVWVNTHTAHQKKNGKQTSVWVSIDRRDICSALDERWQESISAFANLEKSEFDHSGNLHSASIHVSGLEAIRYKRSGKEFTLVEISTLDLDLELFGDGPVDKNIPTIGNWENACSKTHYHNVGREASASVEELRIRFGGDDVIPGRVYSRGEIGVSNSGYVTHVFDNTCGGGKG